MKAYTAFTILLILLLKSFFLFSQQSMWTWMKGDTTINSPPHFGIQGIPDTANTPGAAYESNGWLDLQGNLWLFGGHNLSDLWKYDIASNMWTWINGPGVINQPAIYGIQGIPSIYNNPGMRTYGFVTWVDLQGDLWLFGGSDNWSGVKNDLWRYHIITNEWTWMKGPSSFDNIGNYGTIKHADPLNNPPSRCETTCGWVDNNGDLWLFGGSEIGAVNTYGFGNDLWKFDIFLNQWTWMHGSKSFNQPGNYGINSIPSPQNVPGSRIVYGHWKDSDGNFWLFGGATVLSWTQSMIFNDLWKFDVNNLEWIWISGPNIPNQTGICNGLCQSSINNIPMPRFENTASWNGNCDNLYLFGGFTDNTCSTKWGDLWCYNRFSNEWTFVKGSFVPNTTGSNGKITIAAPLNMPQGLAGSCRWTDLEGNLWMFGGMGFTSVGDNSNQLWKYTPDPQCPYYFSMSNITISHDTSICMGDTLQLFASGGSYYQWSPDMNISNSKIANPVVFPTSTTNYSVKVSDQCGVTDSLNVEIKVFNCKSFIPNVFTPNGDDKNDQFKIMCDTRLSYHIIIFNRWGNKMFESNNIDNSWDGKNNGNETSAGTYFYIITIGDKQYSGAVTLIR